MPPIASQPYTTPARVWELGLPSKTLFGPDSNLAPGVVALPSVVVQTGTGTMDAEGNPHDAYPALRIKCFRAGTINQANIVNPGQLPAFQLSDDGGVTYGRPIVCSRDMDTAYVDDVGRGIRWVLGGAAPVYAVGDEWETSATPSPDIVALVEACSSGCTQFLVGSFKLPLTTWPTFMERVVAWLVRWELIVKRGLSADQDMGQYAPDSKVMTLMGWSAIGWLQAAQRGDFQDDPDFSGAGSVFVEADVMLPMIREPGFGTRSWMP